MKKAISQSTKPQGLIIFTDYCMAIKSTKFRIGHSATNQPVTKSTNQPTKPQRLTKDYIILKNNKICNGPDIAKKIFFATNYLYTRGCSVLIVWIPEHIGIHGNEMEDREAKKGRTINNNRHISLSKEGMKLTIRNWTLALMLVW